MAGQHEGQLPGDFPPCDAKVGFVMCGSTVAFARKSVGDIHVGMFCEQGHRRKYTDGTVEGYWIPQRLFAPGEVYEAVLPEWLFTFSKKKLGDGFDIPERVRRRVLLDQEQCAICGIPSCPADEASLRTARWINDYFPALSKTLSAELRPHRPVSSDAWFGLLSDTAKYEVSRTVRDSRLQADHGFPRKVLAAIAGALTSKQIAFVRSGPIFAACRRCNNGRSGILAESRQQLQEMYVRAYFDGDSERFTRDTERHFMFNEIANLVFGADGRLRADLIA